MILLLFLLAIISSLASETVRLNSGNNSIQIISTSPTETLLQYKISHFEKTKILIDGEAWYQVNMPREGVTQDKGYPQLPVYNRSIIVADKAKMKLEVYDIQYNDIPLQIVPSKGVITRNIDPETIPYSFDKIYSSNVLYPSTIAELSEPYILREFRGITIKTTPFSYNPSTKVLRVCTSYKVRVYEDGTDTKNVLTNNRSSISREFETLYENHFLNWQNYRYTPVSDSFGKLLVICHSSFLTQIADYVNWKKQKGIDTELVDWSTICTTAAQLQTYIQNRYISDNTITYVQLVGDAGQIPTLSITYSGSTGGSDPTFALVAGSDNYPDIFIGRFSAETSAQLTAQINKTVAYERDLTTSASWLTQAMGISDQASTLGDDNETDIQHMNNIRTKLLNHGYSSVDQIYEPSASAATVTTNVNAGRGFINYVGHGANTYWVTTGFSNSNIDVLSNGNKTPFIMDVACVNGNFTVTTCFAEAWLRKANGGAVAMYASSINQSWSAPMRAQDHATDLIVAETKFTAGGLYYNSSCNMMDIYGNTTGSEGVGMYKSWHIFGDVSLMIRTKTPVSMTVTHPNQIFMGAPTLNVSTGVANALVALTYNNTIYARGYTNSIGEVTLTLSDAPQSVISYTITATAFNRVTYIGNIQQILNSGPYMTITAVNYTDSNNSSPEFSETGSLNLTFQNIGSTSSTSVIATLTCSTPGINITDNTETISPLGAGASLATENIFSISIANNIINGTTAFFTVTMAGSRETWEYNFSLIIGAPVLTFGNVTILDPTGNNNGRLDPGETVTASIALNNTGGAACLSGNSILSSPTSGITIIAPNASFAPISAGGNTILNFTVSASIGIVDGTIGTLVFNAASGAYASARNEEISIGTPPVAIIGSGTSSTGTSEGAPINIWYKSLHGQSVYTATELNAAGIYGPVYITELGFYIVSVPNLALPDFIVRMKHTTAINVASWQNSTNMETVYTNSSYMPISGGYEMLSLYVPFLWNGIDNIVIDTAFAPVTTYSETGTVQYTSVINGYRYVRLDTADQTNVFSGGTITTYRPNLRLVYQHIPEEEICVECLTSSEGFTLNWNSITNADEYNIYRSSESGGPYTLIETTTSTNYTDNDGLEHAFYYVTAVTNSAGK